MDPFWTIYFINESEKNTNNKEDFNLTLGLALGLGIPAFLLICCCCISCCREIYDYRRLSIRPTNISPPSENLNIIVI